MEQAVVHVAPLGAEPLAKRKSEWNLSVRPVRADQVHDEKNSDECVRNVGELKVACGNEKCWNEKEHEQVLEQPGLPVQRVDARPYPHGYEASREEHLIFRHGGKYNHSETIIYLWIYESAVRLGQVPSRSKQCKAF